MPAPSRSLEQAGVDRAAQRSDAVAERLQVRVERGTAVDGELDQRDLELPSAVTVPSGL